MVDATQHHKRHGESQGSTECIHPEISGSIIGCAMNVHSILGPGLLEGVYEECLCSEFAEAGLAFERQVSLPIRYGDKTLSHSLRLDLLVEDKVVVEVKAIDQILPVHCSQLLTYLRLSHRRLGLLLNFNVPRLRDGIRRRVL